MKTLDFKDWLATEDASQVQQQNTDKAVEMDPNLSTAAKKAQVAVQTAINKGKNPIKAAQTAIAQSKVPPNKLGQVMPQDQLTQNSN
jgi:hypothetical protein